MNAFVSRLHRDRRRVMSKALHRCQDKLAISSSVIKDRSSVRPARIQAEDQSFGDKEAPVGGHALTGHVIAKLSTLRTVAS